MVGQGVHVHVRVCTRVCELICGMYIYTLNTHSTQFTAPLVFSKCYHVCLHIKTENEVCNSATFRADIIISTIDIRTISGSTPWKQT